MLSTYVYFGPKKSGGRLEQLRLPELATKTVEYKESGIKVECELKFDGTRLIVSSTTISNISGVSTADLTRLKLPKLLREYVYEHNPELSDLIKNKDVDEASLGQLYWAEYVCGGAPRDLIMTQLGIARSTANYHLKNLSKSGLVPKNRSPLPR